jgi:hypothetical protein
MPDNICPETLHVDQVAKGNAPPGMRHVSTKRVHHFKGVLVTTGVPESGIQVVTEIVNTTQSKETVWTVDADVWFSCTYRDTSVQVQGRVAASASECRLIEDKKSFRTVFTCK